MQFAFGGTPPVVERARQIGFFERAFDGSEPSDAVLAYLKGGQAQAWSESDFPQSTVGRIRWKSPYPILRHHFGLPSLEATIEGIETIAEAQALYERAITLEPDVFEAHFNLGNIFHDLGRYTEAQVCYRDALKLNPTYAEAHFYLAVTLEKSGQSRDARPHWRAYQQLAPKGEWVDLAKEFSD